MEDEKENEDEGSRTKSSTSPPLARFSSMTAPDCCHAQVDSHCVRRASAELLKDESPDVRKAAGDALKKIDADAAAKAGIQ